MKVFVFCRDYNKDKLVNLGMKEVSFVPPPQSTVVLRGKSYFVEDTIFLLDYDRCELIVHEQEKAIGL